MDNKVNTLSRRDLFKLAGSLAFTSLISCRDSSQSTERSNSSPSLPTEPISSDTPPAEQELNQFCDNFADGIDEKRWEVDDPYKMFSADKDGLNVFYDNTSGNDTHGAELTYKNPDETSISDITIDLDVNTSGPQVSSGLGVEGVVNDGRVFDINLGSGPSAPGAGTEAGMYPNEEAGYGDGEQFYPTGRERVQDGGYTQIGVVGDSDGIFYTKDGTRFPDTPVATGTGLFTGAEIEVYVDPGAKIDQTVTQICIFSQK